MLQMEISVLGNTLGPERLMPNFMLFWIYSASCEYIFVANQTHRAKVSRLRYGQNPEGFTRKEIAFAAEDPGPYDSKRIDLEIFLFQSPVLIYCTRTKNWEGTLHFVPKDGKTVCVQPPHGIKVFRMTVAKDAPGHQESNMSHMKDASILEV